MNMIIYINATNYYDNNKMLMNNEKTVKKIKKTYDCQENSNQETILNYNNQILLNSNENNVFKNTQNIKNEKLQEEMGNAIGLNDQNIIQRFKWEFENIKYKCNNNEEKEKKSNLAQKIYLFLEKKEDKNKYLFSNDNLSELLDDLDLTEEFFDMQNKRQKELNKLVKDKFKNLDAKTLKNFSTVKIGKQNFIMNTKQMPIITESNEDIK